MTTEQTPPAGPTEIDAARLLLTRLGLTAHDLLDTAADRSPAPWYRILEHRAQRRIDEPTASEIRHLLEHTKTHVVSRRNACGGRGAAEHLLAALRCRYRHAEDDGPITPAANPARKVAKPRRLPSTRRAVPDDRLAEINHIAATTGP